MDDGSLVFLVVCAVVVGVRLIGVVVFVLLWKIVVEVELVFLVDSELIVVVVVVLAVVVAVIVAVTNVFVRAFGVASRFVVVAVDGVLEGGIGFNLFLDALLEFNQWQLQQLHQLDLLWRELQLMPLYLSQSLV